jgi:PGF-pre-PGF domain-containing protein
MKFVLTTFVFVIISIIFSINVSSQPYLTENLTWQGNLMGVRFSTVAWGDVDGDGDLDLSLTGCLNDGGQDCENGAISKIYTNNGTSLVENFSLSQNLTGIGHGSTAWGDIDNDGDLDLITIGCANSTSLCNGNRKAKVYINDDGLMTENALWQFNLTAIWDGNIALSEINNDGRIDLALTGSSSIGVTTKIYINNGISFSENVTWQENLIGFDKASLSFSDLNNDGKIDIGITGEDENSTSTTKIYTNNGSTFAENNSWGVNLKQVYSSAFIFGDYDNDNDMDAVLMGCCDDLYTYKNNGTTLLVSQKSITDGGDLIGIFCGSLGFGDYDNDGDLDFVVTGREDDRNRIYNNNGSKGYLFMDDTGAGQGIKTDNMKYGGLAWGDVDRDGDLDLIITGIDASFDLSTRVYINNFSTPNTNPSSPTSNINSFFNFTTGKLILSWGNGSDTETPTLGLYYNLRAGTCSGCHDIISGVFGGSSGGEWRGGGPSSGYFGNMMQGKSITLNRRDLENKTIYWAVQTIDTGLAKSNWSVEQVYNITQNATQPCTETWSYGEWSTCSNNQQTRTAYDSNSCGSFVNRSAVSQSCSSAPTGPGGGPNNPSIPITPPEDKPEIPENVTWYSDVIRSGVDTGIIINESGLATSQVWVKVRNEVKNVVFDIERLAAKPSTVAAEPEGVVYQYMNITHTNLTDANIESGKMLFNVEKLWIYDNGINKSTVSLNRLTNGVWQALRTTMNGEDNNSVHYLAEVPGFSLFAISGRVLEAPESVCVPGEKKCNDKYVEECNNGGIWLKTESCSHSCEDSVCVGNPQDINFVQNYLWLSVPILAVIIAAVGAVFKLKKSPKTGN